MRRVVVVGASPKPVRYSHRAMQMLMEHGHEAVPVNPGFEEILGQKCYRSIREVPQPIDTATLYLGEARSTPLLDDIVGAKPKRIIMNPGAENDLLAQRAEESGIEVVHDCTLVMLCSGEF